MLISLLKNETEKLTVYEQVVNVIGVSTKMKAVRISINFMGLFQYVPDIPICRFIFEDTRHHS